MDFTVLEVSPHLLSHPQQSGKFPEHKGLQHFAINISMCLISVGIAQPILLFSLVL